jgi:hypothetical protein
MAAETMLLAMAALASFSRAAAASSPHFCHLVLLQSNSTVIKI